MFTQKFCFAILFLIQWHSVVGQQYFSQLPAYPKSKPVNEDSPSGIRTASFDITYNTFSPEAQAAFQYAADIWSDILISDVPIKINAYFTPLLPGVLGITLPNGRKDFTNAPLSATWYATTLANSISGSELNPGEFDMDLFLNSNVAWFFGTTGTCPLTKYDFVSTALHEICHGLGFVGLEKVQSGIGSIGLLKAVDFPLIVTSFPWPDLDTLPSVFDHFLENGNGTEILSFENPSTELATEFTSNSIYWNGSHAFELNNNTKPRIYAPASFALGSSMIHLDEFAYPENSVNELMTPQGGAGVVKHDPGPIAIGILKDIGWNVNYTVGIEEPSSTNHRIQLASNPVTEYLVIAGLQTKLINVEIFDLSGKRVSLYNHSTPQVDVKSLLPGTYFVSVETPQEVFISKFIKL